MDTGSFYGFSCSSVYFFLVFFSILVYNSFLSFLVLSVPLPLLIAGLFICFFCIFTSVF